MAIKEVALDTGGIADILESIKPFRQDQGDPSANHTNQEDLYDQRIKPRNDQLKRDWSSAPWNR